MENGCSLRGMMADDLLRARPCSSERDARVRALQTSIREWLRPHDRQLLCLQSLLLWEQPLQSVLLYSVVNVVFWLLALSSLQLLFIMSSGLVLLVCLNSCRNWTSAEPPCENDSLCDKRSLAHPGILNVSQLSHYVAEMWVDLSSLMGDLVLLRQNSPGKFCFMVCGFLTFLAVLGCYIPGILLSYSAGLVKKSRDPEDTFTCGLGDFPSFSVNNTHMDDTNDSSSDSLDVWVHWDDTKLSSRDCEMEDFEL